MKSLIVYFPAALGVLALAVGIVYCVQNGSGHSGVDPVLASMGFLPILVGGLILLCFRNLRRPGLITSLVGLFGLGFGSFVSRFQIMQDYETWLQSGQPMNDSRLPILFGYVIAIVLSIAAAILVTRSKHLSREEKKI